MLSAAGNVTHTLRPDLYENDVLPRGNPNLQETIEYVYSPEKGKKIIGFTYISEEQMIRDTIADFEQRGWLQKRD